VPQRSEFDDYADNYRSELSHVCRRLVDPGENYFVDLKAAEIHRLVREQGCDPARLMIADIGCGIGDFEKRLAADFKQTLAFDLSLKMVEVAQRLAPLTQGGYLCADCLAIPLADGSADVVFASSMFHHMPENSLAAAVAELARICRSGGLVVCFEHNPFNPVTQMVVRTTPIDKTAKLMRSSAVRCAFAQVGLRQIERRYILFGPKAVDVRLARFGPWLQRVPLGAQYLVAGRKA
jgi:SAM-dependent methyltransferase